MLSRSISHSLKRKSHPKNKISVLKKQKGKYDVSTPGTEPDENGALRHCYTNGSHMVKGKSEHEMEDYVVTKKGEIDDYKLGLYAIFYGHSGHDVADYLKKHLFDDILNEPDFWTDTESAIRRAYKKTDDDILENVVGSRGVSTAVTAILVNGKKMVVANVGEMVLLNRYLWIMNQRRNKMQLRAKGVMYQKDQFTNF